MFRLCKLCYSTAAQAIKSVKIKDVFKKGAINEIKVGRVQGWVQSVRNHKRFCFIDISDGSLQTLQVVLPGNLMNKQIQNGASVSAVGKFVETEFNVNKIEMVCEHIEVTGPCNPDEYPFLKHTPHEMQHLRSYPHLRMRRHSILRGLRLRNQLEMRFHQYFQKHDFTHIHTPVITSSDCEGAGELFNVVAATDGNPTTENNKQSPNKIDSNDPNSNFFDKPAYLTVSGQMHLEACAMALGNVYTLNPAFRAEHGISRKHLSEFRMLEVEVAFVEDINYIMDLIEESIKYSMEEIELPAFQTFEDAFKDIPPNHSTAVENAKSKQYDRIPYSEALTILQNNSKRLKTPSPVWGDDFNTEQESFLVKHCGLKPLFLVDFPKESKPFYMYANDDGKTVSAVDLIFPFCGELCGGSLREHRLEILQSSLHKLGLVDDYDWYLDLRRFGTVPHGGYGLGFDRLVHFLLGTRNIRDAVPFPRSPHSCPL